jgi:phytanoyl-CoA hydroxylase
VVVTDLPPGALRHPWNRSFTWSVPSTPPSTLSFEQKDAFDRDGFVVLTGLIDADTISALTTELDELEAHVEHFLADQEGGRFHIAESGAITFTVHAVLRSPAARRFATHAALLGLCRDLLGPDVNLYWDQAVYKKPEKPRRFPWHQDTGYTFADPQDYLTCWVALTDATVTNGCPWVLPRVHRNGTLLHHWIDPIGWECLPEEPDGAVAAEVPAGGVVAFSSLTPHLTRPNTTTEVRKSYIVQYARSSARTMQGDWQRDEAPTGSAPCDDPDRQFAVLRAGEPV